MLTGDALVLGFYKPEDNQARSQNGLSSRLQWLLALEKAYLEFENKQYEMDDYISLASGQVKTSSDPGSAAASERVAPASQNEIQNESYAAAECVPTVADESPRPLPISNCQRPNDIQRVFPGVAGPQQQMHRGALRTNTLLHSTQPQLHSELLLNDADRESINLIETEKGIFLYIRSREMDSLTAFRLGMEVQSMLAEKGRTLAKVLYNGKRLENLGILLKEEKLATENSDHRLNKTY